MFEAMMGGEKRPDSFALTPKGEEMKKRAHDFLSGNPERQAQLDTYIRQAIVDRENPQNFRDETTARGRFSLLEIPDELSAGLAREIYGHQEAE